MGLRDILNLNMLENIMMERLIDQNMSDLSQILSVDLSKLNPEMIHFLNEFLHLQRNKYVARVMDLGSKNPIFQ